MKKDPVIKTKRLLITPLSDEQLEERINSATDESLKGAYREMLDGCIADPEHRLWYTAWDIRLKSDNTSIGDLGFKGPQKNAAVEIGYGLDESQWGNGYATEAARAAIDWAFSQTGVYFVEAETDPDNAASQRVLEKLGFSADGTFGEEGPRFVLEKPLPSWFAVYMCLGISVGTSFGLAADRLSVGMCIGLAFGVCIGCSLDAAEKKKRKELRSKRTE